MSKSKFTPLPWALKTFENGTFIITEGEDTDDLNNRVIASIGTLTIGGEESIANAELLKDAPEMLEDIRTLVNELWQAHCKVHVTDINGILKRPREILERHGG